MERRDIGWAIKQMQDGHKVRRSGWNGKGMWLVLMPALQLPPYSSQMPGAKVNDRTARHIGQDTKLDSQPYIAMWTADQKWQPGWLCSQADLLATDWELAVASEPKSVIVEGIRYTRFSKTNNQVMRPYVKGEDLSKVSIGPTDVPEVGGMIAVNPDKPEDKWYVSKAFFEANYVPVV